MIFYIDSNFANNYPRGKESEVKRALKYVFNADITGNHKVIFDKLNTINCLLGLFEHNDEDTHTFLRHCVQSCNDRTDIPPFITKIFRIATSDGDNNVTVINNVECMPVAYSLFVNDEFLNKLHLIGEDRNDTLLYELIAKSWFQHIKGSNPAWGKVKIPNLSIFHHGGGGKNTYNTLEECRDNKYSCLAVIDTDQKFPIAVPIPSQHYSDTCNSCLKVEGRQDFLQELVLLNMHEIENLIPAHILVEVLDKNNDGLKHYRQLFDNIKYCDTDMLRYYDMKEGIAFVGDIDQTRFQKQCVSIMNPDMTNQEINVEFDNASKKTEKKDKVIIPGMGSNILSSTIRYMNKNWKRIDFSLFKPYQRDEWKKISELIISYGYANNERIF